jgi:glucosyl-3-phosphoglycerate phosphatase
MTGGMPSRAPAPVHGLSPSTRQTRVERAGTPARSAAAVSRRVLVLRHGRTSWNAERRFQGQADPELDEVGRAQGYEVAALLAALHPTAIVTSDLLRAAQTAAPLGELTGVEVAVDARLRERSLGHWEGLTRDEVQQRYPQEFTDWICGRDVSGRGGETREQVADRAMAAFADLPDVEVAVIVTHSATAMALCARLIGLSQRVHTIGPLANCHWSELWCETANGADAGFWRLRAHNVGAPGPVIPVPLRPDGPDDDGAPDAEA